MKFTYIYRSSDGERHEGEVEAQTRDEAFALLRQQKIRPVKVVSASGSKANGEEKIITRKRFVVVALGIGVLLGALVSIWAVQRDWRDGRLVDLERKAEKLLAHNEYVLGTLNLDELRDFKQIRDGRGSKLAEQKVALANCTIDGARREVRELFCGKIALFAGEKKLEAAALGLYLTAMDAVDRHQGRIAREERAYRILLKNVGKWKMRNGAPHFDDAELNQLYGDLTGAVSPAR